ncbi:hypothetical protein BS297_23345 [Rhodococcus erythropolis]|uniref:Uncharacterized protein n=1 Tax=Rhodococcus erythropolis TaxID=1833 RepID=A0A5N5DYD5_RHOER|nr:hypothetical protein BS297_23345 [Rhodococcus erythropolis]
MPPMTFREFIPNSSLPRLVQLRYFKAVFGRQSALGKTMTFRQQPGEIRAHRLVEIFEMPIERRSRNARSFGHMNDVETPRVRPIP